MKKISFYIPFILPAIILMSSYSCAKQEKRIQSKVKTGAEVLIEKYLHELEGKRAGLVMNPTARIGNVHLLDTLLALNVQIEALFAPEHGFRGSAGAGEVIKDGVDEATGLPVYSLYGSIKKPTSEMLEGVDILIFDMQDVGARFYTYNSTMKYVIEAAADNGKEVWILDRPNPAGGDYVSGWVLEKEFESFVGTYPVPVAHGLTLGELAQMAKGEGWFETKNEPEIKVIKMEGWQRVMKWPDTGLKWIPPSPNLPAFEHAYVYLGTCFFEGTSLSEGRGTEDPFLLVGSPTTKTEMIDLKQLQKRFDVLLDTIRFKPVSIPGKAVNPKFEDQEVKGVKVSLSGKSALPDPVLFGIHLMKHMMDASPEAKYKKYLYNLAGTTKIDSVDIKWGDLFDTFLKKRKGYFLYN